MAGKCPACGGFVTVVNGHCLTINIDGGSFKGITYQCPMCQTVLGCQIDPIAVRTEIVDAVKEILKR